MWNLGLHCAICYLAKDIDALDPYQNLHMSPRAPPA